MEARASHMSRDSHVSRTSHVSRASNISDGGGPPRSSHNSHTSQTLRSSHNSQSHTGHDHGDVRSSHQINSHSHTSQLPRESHMSHPPHHEHDPRASHAVGPHGPGHDHDPTSRPSHATSDASHAPSSVADPNKPKLLKGRRRGRRGPPHHSKVRVRLPPIESYERELEYTADGPGRVVVRLERLMGTDRVRLTDTKYMSTLLERLEEEERKAWTKRRVARIKTERDRFRKLAIDGLMEPGPDMQDLLQHPVFRVNRVLNYLAKMDTNTTLTPHDKLPPIIEVDPFLDDDSGAAFKSYPGHNSLHSSWINAGPRSTTDQFARLSRKSLSNATTNFADAAEDEEEEEEEEKAKAKQSVVKMHVPAGDGEEELPEDDESVHHKYRKTSAKVQHVDELFDESSHHVPIRGKSRTFEAGQIHGPQKRLSEIEFPDLSEMEKHYGIDPKSVFWPEWEPFRSYLVDAVFRDDGEAGIQKLYDLAEAVTGVYEREVLVGDDFVSELNKIMRGEAH